MEQQEFENFIFSEVEKIKIDKWIEGEKTHRDSGHDFEMEWVEKNAKNYRDAWNKSKCKTCKCCKKCGYNTLSACEEFKENDKV